MKAAMPTNDGKKISQHFGRCKYFVVIELEKGEVRKKETRRNIKEAHKRKECGKLFDLLKDCNIIICYNMGARIYNEFKSKGIEVQFTDEEDIERTIKSLQEKWDES